MIGPSRARPEIKALTSLRGLAAMAVVLQHFSSTAQHHASGWIPSLVPHGYMAVDFFFVLSGFIMSYTYLADFEARGISAFAPFLWKRIARIFPLGIAVTVIIVCLGQLAEPFGLTRLFYSLPPDTGLGTVIAINLLHLQGLMPLYSLNDPSWSVSVELGAYLVFPLLIYLNAAARPWVTAAYTALGIWILLRLSAHDPTGGMAFRSPSYDLARCIIEFGFGMLVFRAYRQGGPLGAFGRDRWTLVVAAIAVLSLIGRSDLAAVAVFPFLVLAFALNTGRPSRILSHPWLHYLGTISFSIYLVHQMFRELEFWLIRQIHPAPLPPWMALACAAIGAASVLPFAAMAYHGIERPGRTALNGLVRRLGRLRTAPVPAAPARD